MTTRSLPARVRALAALLDAADAALQPLSASGIEPVRTLEEAYAAQREFVALRAARTQSKAVGFKVAATSAAAQKALRIDEPLAGRLLTVDVYPTGSTVELRQRFSPLIEVELLFRTTTDLQPGATEDEIAAAVEVSAGLECADSRFADFFGGEYPVLSVNEVVADNCLAGIVVTGPRWITATSIAVQDVTAQLFVNSEPVQQGTSANVLGNPLRAISWLSSHLAATDEALVAGTVVSSGTLTVPVPAVAGSVMASFDSGLGDVAVTFR